MTLYDLLLIFNLTHIIVIVNCVSFMKQPAATTTFYTSLDYPTSLDYNPTILDYSVYKNSNTIDSAPGISAVIKIL